MVLIVFLLKLNIVFKKNQKTFKLLIILFVIKLYICIDSNFAAVLICTCAQLQLIRSQEFLGTWLLKVTISQQLKIYWYKVKTFLSESTPTKLGLYLLITNSISHWPSHSGPYSSWLLKCFQPKCRFDPNFKHFFSKTYFSFSFPFSHLKTSKSTVSKWSHTNKLAKFYVSKF